MKAGPKHLTAGEGNILSTTDFDDVDLQGASGGRGDPGAWWGVVTSSSESRSVGMGVGGEGSEVNRARTTWLATPASHLLE